MAKTKFNIAEAMRGEMKAAPVTAEKPEETKEILVKPVETAVEEPIEEPAAVPAEPVVAPVKRPRGRPKKNDEERGAFIRATVPVALKEKLHIVSRYKGLSENDYLYAIVKKTIERDFEQAFSGIQEKVK